MQVHTLTNPTFDSFGATQRALEPSIVYFQGEQLENEEEIGSIVWDTADASDPQTLSSLLSPPLPTIVSFKLLEFFYSLCLSECCGFRYLWKSMIFLAFIR